MKSLHKTWRIFFVVIVAIFLPVLCSHISLLLETYIDGKPLAGGILLTVVFYVIQSGVAMLLGILIMICSIREMGFNASNFKLTLKMLGWFIPIWFLVVVLFYVIGLNCIADFDTFITHYYVKDKLTMQKDLVIGCLLTGIGEEPLFRGFVVSSLIVIITRYISVGKAKIPLVALLSGLLFALAHIEYQIMPFRIIYTDGIQLCTTFILGTFWSIMFIKTKSLIGPIIAHMCANVIQIMGGYIVAYYFL